MLGETYDTPLTANWKVSGFCGINDCQTKLRGQYRPGVKLLTRVKLRSRKTSAPVMLAPPGYNVALINGH